MSPMMQRFPTYLLMVMLYLVSSISSAQQFDSFVQVGESRGISAGTVTSISLAQTGSRITFFNAAGFTTVFDLNLTPSQVIRDSMSVFMPAEAFPEIEPSMDLDDVSFFTGELIDPLNPGISTPANWFRLTLHNDTWSGAFRIADRIYAINRSQPDNVVEVRATPSQNQSLRPVRRIKVTAIIDEEFVFADSPGDSVGMDNLGHIYALESLHVMEGVMNDSLGITLTLDQLIYQRSSELASPALWLDNNATSFGIEDNFSSFIFRGDESITPAVSSDLQRNYTVLSKLDFQQLTTAHQFGKLLGIAEESGTLQSNENPLDAAHWSESQKSGLLAALPNTSLIQIISSDAPEIEITETDDIINLIPQDILDAEIVESEPNQSAATTDAGNPLAIGNGLLQDDEQDNSITTGSDETPDGGGGKLSPAMILSLLLFSLLAHRRTHTV